MLTLAQTIMLLTLLLMLSGRTPLYLTAIVGSAITALAAGFPISGKSAVTITKMINSGLIPVIADITGILMFIGVMQGLGFMDIIIRAIVRLGNRMGGGPGVAVAGGVAAGCIGALTGFTQAAVTAVITGPASVKLGVDPNKSAGVHAHAGHLGNFGGFTHPTQITILATAGLGFGLYNVYASIIALSVFAASFMRLKLEERSNGVNLTREEVNRLLAEFGDNKDKSAIWKALAPFAILVAGFSFGFPIFLVSAASAIVAMAIARSNPKDSERDMISGVARIATPIVAIISFLFLSTVIRNIGLVDILSNILSPVLSVAPVQVMWLVAALAGLLTQSYSASTPVIIPFLQAVLAAGANPMAAAIAAGGGAAIAQYYLTGGPLSALPPVISVIPGTDLKTANRFQRPSILFGIIMAFVVSTLLSF